LIRQGANSNEQSIGQC
jgi:hypothetical protein